MVFSEYINFNNLMKMCYYKMFTPIVPDEISKWLFELLPWSPKLIKIPCFNFLHRISMQDQFNIWRCSRIQHFLISFGNLSCFEFLSCFALLLLWTLDCYCSDFTVLKTDCYCLGIKKVIRGTEMIKSNSNNSNKTLKTDAQWDMST